MSKISFLILLSSTPFLFSMDSTPDFPPPPSAQKAVTTQPSAVDQKEFEEGLKMEEKPFQKYLDAGLKTHKITKKLLQTFMHKTQNWALSSQTMLNRSYVDYCIDENSTFAALQSAIVGPTPIDVSFYKRFFHPMIFIKFLEKNESALDQEAKTGKRNSALFLVAARSIRDSYLEEIPLKETPRGIPRGVVTY